jgi:chromosomal replication initiation ATPase DnaA
VFINGERATGKTHLAAYCAGVAQVVRGQALVVNGANLSELDIVKLSHQKAKPSRRRPAYDSGDNGGGILGAVVIDDADLWLNQASSEGALTALDDLVHQSRALVVLLSSAQIDALSLSSQIRSRIVAGVRLTIGVPKEAELGAILDAICKQRGIALTEAKRDFVLRRVARTVSALTSFGDHLQAIGATAAASTSFEVLAEAVRNPAA